ncbi:zinc finger, CCHC-type containing protein [Tanacetum coccineum]
MISEVFSLKEEKSWWVDSGATRHVCNDHTMFKTYEPSYSMLYMGNHSTAQVKGKGKIDLVFTCGNILTLNDVLHVPDVRNLFSNLISSSSPKVASSLAKAITPVELELKCDTRIKCLRTDKGGEYYDPRYFQSTGIVHQVTASYTPQQNGIAERKNRTLMDMVNSMMSYFGLSSGYWGEALLTACYILNRVPNKRIIKTSLTLGSKAIKSTWIFKRKLRVDGSIEKFKARLVARGFTQREGLDYFDTYALVVRTTTIRILIALASINKLIIHQMDGKAAFLNGELEEEVYMEQPEVGKPFVCSSIVYTSDIAYVTGAAWLSVQRRKEPCTTAKRSTSGYIFMLSGGHISWRSHEQELSTTSTMMAEYVACYHAASHAFILRNLVSGLKVTL